MAAHTYWRLYIGTVSSMYAQMGIVSFLNAAQVNQSIGGVATASSEFSGSWAADNAFDGNSATEWASAATYGPEWIAYQHPSPVDIVFVGVKVSASYPVSGLALQYSDDGVSWSAASPLHLLAGQPALDTGAYTVLGLSGIRKPLVLADGKIRELPEGDTLPPQTPATHSHATSDVTGLDAALAGKEPTISAGTTAQYWRGNKAWRDFFTDVRAATLTGLSTATNAVITAADTVLAALGKLQKQISAHLASTANAHPASAISNTPSGGIAATNVQAAINELDSEKLPNTGGTVTGNLLVGSGVIGYGAGSGGTVTQPTSKSTGVTLNNPGGMVTTHAESLGAGATANFVLNSASIAATDVVVVCISYHGGAGPNYRVSATTGLAGQAVISLQNISGAARAEAIEIHFAVIKKANA